MKATRLILSLLFIVGISAISLAEDNQPPGFGGNDGGNTPNDAGPTPISSLVVLGIAVGGFIGYKTLKK